MSLEEKVGQLLMVHFHGEEANVEAKTLIQDLHVGGFIYYNWSNTLSSPEQIKKLSEGLQKLSTTPLLIAVDQEGGSVARLKNGFTQFPGNASITSMEMSKQTGFTLGKELKQVGINIDFAPVVDVLSDPDSPVGSRSFGADSRKVITYAKAMIDGFHEAGTMTTLKHFPGLGGVKVDSHFGLPVINLSFKEGLIPFIELKGVTDAIMTAHVLVPELDPAHCATLSKKVLDLLQPFEGVIISDSLIMEGVLKEMGSVEQAALQAFNAGCDILLLGGKLLINGTENELTIEDVRKIKDRLVQAVQKGEVAEERLNKSVGKILNLKKKI